MGDGWRRFCPTVSHTTIGVAEWAGQALDRLGETPLYPATPDQPLTVRLLCLPTWQPACSVRIEDNGLLWRLVGRELSGEEAGYELGGLDYCESRQLSVVETDQVVGLWEYLRFWSLAVAGEEDVFDGTTYVLEAAEHGRYRVVRRDDLEWGDTFGEFADLLVRLAGLAPR